MQRTNSIGVGNSGSRSRLRSPGSERGRVLPLEDPPQFVPVTHESGYLVCNVASGDVSISAISLETRDTMNTQPLALIGATTTVAGDIDRTLTTTIPSSTRIGDDTSVQMPLSTSGVGLISISAGGARRSDDYCTCVTAVVAGTVSPDDKDGEGGTPLHRAAEVGHDECVALLLALGADVHWRGRYGLTPLHVAAFHGHTGCVEQVLMAGADLGEKGADGSTPLHNAALNGHSGSVGRLVDAGADLQVMDNYGNTPLHDAALRGHVESALLLMAAGAQLLARNHGGCTPLHLAALDGHDALIRRFADAGADVNAKDTTGRTPLHLAAMSGHCRSVEQLLDAGADVHAVDCEGRTPLQLASDRTHTSCVAILGLISL